MKTSIALIGFMGSGKTVVGKALAEKLGKEFVEMDILIEQKAGKTIPEIFQEDGEVRFRELEIEVAKELSGKKNAVIACGGGVVLNKINIDRLGAECIIVYLRASPQVILRRTSGDRDERPLLRAADKDAHTRELIKYRQPFYERAADMEIDTSKMGVDSVAERVTKKVKADESYH